MFNFGKARDLLNERNTGVRVNVVRAVARFSPCSASSALMPVQKYRAGHVGQQGGANSDARMQDSQTHTTRHETKMRHAVRESNRYIYVRN